MVDQVVYRTRKTKTQKTRKKKLKTTFNKIRKLSPKNPGKKPKWSLPKGKDPKGNKLRIPA